MSSRENAKALAFAGLYNMRKKLQASGWNVRSGTHDVLHVEPEEPVRFVGPTRLEDDIRAELTHLILAEGCHPDPFSTDAWLHLTIEDWKDRGTIAAAEREQRDLRYRAVLAELATALRWRDA